MAFLNGILLLGNNYYAHNTAISQLFASEYADYQKDYQDSRVVLVIRA